MVLNDLVKTSYPTDRQRDRQEDRQTDSKNRLNSKETKSLLMWLGAIKKPFWGLWVGHDQAMPWVASEKTSSLSKNLFIDYALKCSRIRGRQGTLSPETSTFLDRDFSTIFISWPAEKVLKLSRYPISFWPIDRAHHTANGRLTSPNGLGHPPAHLWNTLKNHSRFLLEGLTRNWVTTHSLRNNEFGY